MDYVSLFQELLKLSPFVAALFFFLFTVWNTMQKKDAALLATMKEHSAQMLANQKETILALNNAADASRQLSGSIDKLGDNQDEFARQLADIKSQLPRNGQVRRPAATAVTPAASA